MLDSYSSLVLSNIVLTFTRYTVVNLLFQGTHVSLCYFVPPYSSVNPSQFDQLQGASQETLEILKNKEIIAINQDPVVGTSITPFRWGVNVRRRPSFTLRDRLR